jgi:hypothetical protein
VFVEGDVWSSFAHDPRDPAVSSLRASDADREVVHGVLAEAFADGRLDRTEYDDRSSTVLAARTLGELPPIVADLVPNLPARTTSGYVPLVAATSADIQRRAEKHWEDERRNAFFGFVGPTLICWIIYLSYAGISPDFSESFPWPLIVTVVSFLNLLKTATGRDQIIASEVKRLERRQAEKLEKKQREE